MSAEPSLFERIGGTKTIENLMTDFYGRVMKDPELAPYFESVTMDKLIRMQREFFGAALDGPQQYSGLSLAHAHGGRGIKAKHFNRFSQHLLETLKSQGIKESDIAEIIGRVNTYADDIIGGSTVSE